MAVIKCSNCENEILDTEIVCPYCDCPISETIKKMKKDDLETYSNNSIDGLTGKIPPVKPKEETPIATSSDFAKEKAAILKELGIKPVEETKAADEDKKDPKDDASDPKPTAESKPVPANDTQENNEQELIKSETPIDKGSDSSQEASPKTDTVTDRTVKISKDTKIKQEATKHQNTQNVEKNKSKNTSAPQKTNSVQKKKSKKKSKGKYIVLGITIIGIIVVIYLIMGIANSITDGINKTKKINKTVTVSDSAASSAAELGYELHSSTLTIIDDDVMKDYDSPQDTPWYKYKDKIKHVTFGKKITKIGSHSFEGFENITDINISDSVKIIGESAFCNCTSLTKITNMSKNIEEIGDYAFTGCKNLSKIPGYTEEDDFEPTVEKIGIEAFKSCKELLAFRIPMYTEIGQDAFFGHSEDFVIICERTSDAYVYASENGIPTKTNFDSEATDSYETSPNQPTSGHVTSSQPTSGQTTSGSASGKKADKKESKSEKSDSDNETTKEDNAQSDNNTSSESSNSSAPQANSSQTTTKPSTTQQQATPPQTSAPQTTTPNSDAPIAGIAPSATNPGGPINSQTVMPSGSTSDVSKAVDRFNEAQTPEQKQNALQEIAKITGQSN